MEMNVMLTPIVVRRVTELQSRRWRHDDLVTTLPINDRTWRTAA
jgi:hypothetical protein